MNDISNKTIRTTIYIDGIDEIKSDLPSSAFPKESNVRRIFETTDTKEITLIDIHKNKSKYELL